MRHEKTIKLSTGAKLKCEVKFSSDSHRDTYEWSYTLWYCPNRKRTFEQVEVESNSDSDFIFETMRELWEKLHPIRVDVPFNVEPAAVEKMK